MTEIAPNIAWQEQLEKHFCDTGEKAHSLGWLHKQSEARYSQMKNFTDLPVIILGVLNGAASIGSNSLFNDAKMASVGVGAIALLTAILSTVSSFFGWARRAEAHRIASLQYAKLYRTLSLQMSLPRHERMSPSDLLKFTKEAYDRMAETAPLIPPQVISEYRHKFGAPKYDGITKPEEANGLEAITVYHTPATDSAATEAGFRVAAASQAASAPARPSVAVEVVDVSGTSLAERRASLRGLTTV
jgi:hypothetical protein